MGEYWFFIIGWIVISWALYKFYAHKIEIGAGGLFDSFGKGACFIFGGFILEFTVGLIINIVKDNTSYSKLKKTQSVENIDRCKYKDTTCSNNNNECYKCRIFDEQLFSN